jgi:cyclic pyranopterin phosphate synthase
MPGGRVNWFKRDQLLTFEEIRRIVTVLVSLGVRQVRLTGGEPLLRRDLPLLVRMLSDLPGLDEVTVTTNGLLLPSLAAPLLEAGVSRFSVHLDSLENATFRETSRRDSLSRALAGLSELERQGATPIKVNVVLIRGINDHEIPRFGDLARRRPYQVRFIELMPLGGGEPLEAERLVPGSEARRRLEAICPLMPIGRDRPSAPANRFGFADGVGDVGFINPVTEPFCVDCDRIRLTADGMIRNCLFARSESNLKAMLRQGATDEEIAAAIRENVISKDRGGCLDLHDYYKRRLPRKMWQIGG